MDKKLHIHEKKQAHISLEHGGTVDALDLSLVVVYDLWLHHAAELHVGLLYR